MVKTEFSKVNDLFLAYPKDFNDVTKDLITFYQKLIGIIPDNIRQFVIVNNQYAGNEIKYLYPEKNIQPILINDFNEIWLRDIMGFNSGIGKIYKPTYRPDYCKHIYTSEYLRLIDRQVREIINKSIGAEVIEMPLILDGGNFITNGKEGFVTDKIIIDNESSPEEINKIFMKYLGIEAVILPSNSYDKLAHVDGYMNFLSEKTMCLSQYPNIDFLKADIEYVMGIKKQLEDRHFEITRIYDRPVSEKVVGSGEYENDKASNCLNSARGIYINFLLLNDTIILPEYTLPNYKKQIDYNMINKQAFTDLGYTVITLNCDELAWLGGSLHCISFTN